MAHRIPLSIHWRALVLACMTTLTSGAAMAQWQWVDSTGRKVFSDTPPPAGVPDERILRRPGVRTPAVTASSAPAAVESAAADAPTAPKPSVRDEQLEARKKQVEDAEQAKKKAEEERLAKARAENCERAKRAKATLDSGIRIATINAKGEREIMDDNGRAGEIRRINEILRSDCGATPN